jgi:hypothetical protein
MPPKRKTATAISDDDSDYENDTSQVSNGDDSSSSSDESSDEDEDEVIDELDMGVRASNVTARNNINGVDVVTLKMADANDSICWICLTGGGDIQISYTHEDSLDYHARMCQTLHDSM